MKKFKIINLVLIILLLSINVISFTLSKYSSTLNKTVLLNISSNSYTVVFHSNNGEDLEVSQMFTIGESQRLNANTFTNQGLSFAGWNTEIDGTGVRYSDSEMVIDLTSTPNDVVDLYAQWSDGVALVNGEVCDSLQKAINKVPTTGALTTVILLKDVQEELTVSSGKNIIFDFGNHTLTNPLNNRPIIENAGTTTIMNGNVISNATAAGAINNRGHGVLYINGGRIINTGDRQAVYNDVGVITISGDAYLENTGSARAALQNQANSTITITGGTIISRSTNAIQNASSLTIGTKNDNPDSNILIRGANYGVTSTGNYSFYDGVIEGANAATNNDAKIVNVEDKYLPIHDTETVDSVTYDKLVLTRVAVVTFDPNKGVLANTTRKLLIGSEVGNLPTPTRSNYSFQGWYTGLFDGIKIDAHTIINEDVTFYAHWKANSGEVAKIGDVTYNSIQDAVDDCPDGIVTTITILKDVTTSSNISATKNIVIDLDSHTLTANSGSAALFENSGNLTIQNGNLRSSNGASTINQNNGYLKLDNVTVNSHGDKQSLYIAAGTVEITGNSYLSSDTSGKSSLGVLARGTVHVMSGAEVIINNATIIGTQGNGISNEGGIVTLGVKDGTIDTTSVIIQAKRDGVETTSTFNFYDGIIKGYVETINGTITDQEDNSHIVDDTEVIDTDTYKTKYLELD